MILSINTRGISQDYKWLSEGNSTEACEALLEFLNEDTNPCFALLVERHENSCRILVRFSSPYTDVRGRSISVHICCEGLSDTAARRLALRLLAGETSRKNFQTAILKEIIWNSPEFPDQEWGVNFSKVRSVIESFIETGPVVQTGIPFPDAWIKPWNDTSERELVEELSHYTFSPGPGIKIFLGKTPNKYSQLCNEADRIIWLGNEEKRLNREPLKKNYLPLFLLLLLLLVFISGTAAVITFNRKGKSPERKEVSPSEPAPIAKDTPSNAEPAEFP